MAADTIAALGAGGNFSERPLLIYEMRVYEAMPGKMATLQALFHDHMDALFIKHGFRAVGYWTEAIGDNTLLNYMLAWDDSNQMEERWRALRTDPDFRGSIDASNVKGAVVARMDTRTLRPTAFSPLP